MDVTSVGLAVDLAYESLCAGDQMSNVIAVNDCGNSLRDAQYSANCTQSSDLFGCVGLRNKKYCILNKQYNPDKYKKLRAQIIEDMKKRDEYGEFFPAEMSPFGYNETQAQDYFPLTNKEAIKQGFKWKEPERKKVEISGDIIACAHAQNCDHLCPGGFRMIPREKDFCDRMRIPYPTLCFNCRYKELISWRNPPALYKRNCMKCNADIETSYAPDRPEIVYCESCYNAEVA